MGKWIAVGLGLIVGLVLIAGVVIYPDGQWNGGTLKFDAKVWRAEKNLRNDNPRGKMVNSLLRDSRLVGQTRSEIIQLLGPPDGINDHMGDALRESPSDTATAREFRYVLGAYSGFGMDYDILSLDFDQEGKVRRCRVWQS